MITVVDYGLGNLGSVANALERIRVPFRISSNGKDIIASDALILPGDGAAGAGMNNLKNRNLITPIKKLIESGRPFLGICLGMQLLLDQSDEGDVLCLGFINGKVKKFGNKLKVPQIGWNRVTIKQWNNATMKQLFSNIPNCSYFYFIHSYYCEPKDQTLIIATTDYQSRYCSVFVKGNIIGVQFHPEKSGDTGLQLLKNFVSIT